MTIFKQGDPQWGGMFLGNTKLSMADFGCTTTAITQALYLAGYTELNPGIVCQEFTKHGVYNKSGQILWDKIQDAFPQFHYGGTGYNFIQGIWGKYLHWVLLQGATIYEPFYGLNQRPDGFTLTGVNRTASITPKPEEEVTELEINHIKVDGLEELLLRDLNDGDAEAIIGRSKILTEAIASGKSRHDALNDLAVDVIKNAQGDDRQRLRALFTYWLTLIP